METAVIETPPAVQTQQSWLLALTGRRYCGKSRAADMVAKFDPRFRILSFADVLKEEFSKESGIELKKLYQTGIKDFYRPQLFEFEAQRKAGNRYYFAEKLFERVRPNDLVVIDDLRFIEELAMCVQKSAVIYKVHAEPHHRVARGWKYSEVDDHYSETELDYSGYLFHQVTGGKGGTIFNTRDDAYLRMQLIGILKAHFPL